MKTKISAVGALLAAMAFAPQANATVVGFHFSGSGFSGEGHFTIAPNVAPADPNLNCGTPGENPCRTDPAGAFAITGITGTFSDSALGLTNAVITGLVPINPANERDPIFDPLVPSSLSFVDYALPDGYLTYNNLFFPDGSPLDCAYPFFGTFLDVFGVAFTVDGGYTVDLWGNGDVQGVGKNYGVRVTDGTKEVLNQSQGVAASAPEPATLALFGAGLFGVAGWRKRTKRASALA